ncbi:hypothetical protein QT196_14905 [Streptomyces sp. P9-2B-2]|uniref:hypothetical protein n=1 Tax=Streptomyces TaxID=1883 RepID=UPI00225990F6|nr:MULTISPECIES: hypothetical protein [Streptomyces]MCX4634590.1 hypothetical protein [Streptomyces platensis]WJY38470.1 hypothetical protein QT196_14905 [Streptomyces sp. P9-2B-2]
MTSGPPEPARLLPWAGAGGKPCYLIGDGTGFLSRIADDTELAQLDLASELLDQATRILIARAWTAGEIHLLALQLTESLREVKRIAESRGERLPSPTGDGGRFDETYTDQSGTAETDGAPPLRRP